MVPEGRADSAKGLAREGRPAAGHAKPIGVAGAHSARSAACGVSRHGPQVAAPSTGGRRPQRLHRPASTRALRRFALTARALRLLAIGFLPP